MPRPIEPEYPKPMYRGDRPPIYATSVDDEDKKAADGWSPFYIPRAFPARMYDANSTASVIVQDAAERQAKLDAGWLAEPLAQHYPPVETIGKVMQMPGAEPGSPAALAANNSQFVMLQQQLLEQQKLINQLLLERRAEPADDEKPELKKKRSA